MANDSIRYRLWQHHVRETTGARTIIAKVRPGGASANATVAAALGAGRSALARRDDAPARLARLLDNGYVSAITAVFGDDDATRAPTTLRMLAGVARSATRHRRRQTPARSGGIVEIRCARGTDPARLSKHLAGLGDIEYAFIPPARRLFGRQSASAPDPLASRQWAHGAIRLGHARSAPGFDDASSITVAVVDSGIDEAHPDLAPAISEYRNFLRESGKDYAGHGTHVAGIIAAVANNGLGISGVCGARILALKALPRDGNAFDAAAYYRALRYAIGRAHVLNLSLGGDKDPAEIDILRDVIDAGVVVIAAMGNEYQEGNPTSYPAAMPEVCAVGATDQLDKRARFSNTGRHIDLVAPGVAILSTTPTHTYDDGVRNYDAWDGTSMATPHVAGAAALVLARHPNDTPARVIRRLMSSADRVAGAKKGCPAYGAGRLNCQRALK